MWIRKNTPQNGVFNNTSSAISLYMHKKFRKTIKLYVKNGSELICILDIFLYGQVLMRYNSNYNIPTIDRKWRVAFKYGGKKCI